MPATFGPPPPQPPQSTQLDDMDDDDDMIAASAAMEGHDLNEGPDPGDLDPEGENSYDIGSIKRTLMPEIDDPDDDGVFFSISLTTIHSTICSFCLLSFN